jgi:hypothetical protein
VRMAATPRPPLAFAPAPPPPESSTGHAGRFRCHDGGAWACVWPPVGRGRDWPHRATLLRVAPLHPGLPLPEGLAGFRRAQRRLSPLLQPSLLQGRHPLALSGCLLRRRLLPLGAHAHLAGRLARVSWAGRVARVSCVSWARCLACVSWAGRGVGCRRTSTARALSSASAATSTRAAWSALCRSLTRRRATAAASTPRAARSSRSSCQPGRWAGETLMSS